MILPGIFSDADSLLVRHLAENLSRKGYHVAAFHNPWSVRMIRSQPRAKPGNPRFEAELALEYSRSVLQRIGRENVSSLSLLGVSYGGLLAAAAYALDGQKTIDGGVLLLSPPLGLREAAENLDAGIERYERRFRECKPVRFAGQAIGKIFFGRKTKQDDLSTRKFMR